MRLKRHRDWSISSKIMSIPLVTALLLALATMYLTGVMHDLIMTEKQHALVISLQQATSLFDSYQKQVQAGTLPLEEAKRRAIERIGAIRYDGASSGSTTWKTGWSCTRSSRR